MSSPLDPFINQILCGDAHQILKRLPGNSVDCVITSPPYWALRDYGVTGQLGLEPTFQEYLVKLCDIFDEVKRVLKTTGTCWVNMGDTYASTSKGNSSFEGTDNDMYARLRKRANVTMMKLISGLPAKTLCQIPARFSIEMINRGWILRNEIIWHKPNCMPTSAKDRFTVDFEKLFFFVKSRRYYFERQFEELHDRTRLTRRFFNPETEKKRVYGAGRVAAINPQTIEASRLRMLEHGRNKRSVWRVATRPYYGDHFATYPPELIETPLKAGCPEGGVVLDPFMGSGTTALVARQYRRQFIGIELNPSYVRLARKRLLSG